MNKRLILAGYVFVAPFLLLFLLFSLFPMIFSILVSLFKWNGITSWQFVGIRNYLRLMSDPVFWHSLLNTIVLITIAIPLQIGIGMILASLLREYWRKSIPLFRVINFLPYLTASIAIGILFEFIFDEQVGFVNMFLNRLGFSNLTIHWLTDPALIKVVVIILLVWRYYGYMMLIIIAGLQTIPDSLFEVAQIDGAKWHQRLIYITIPLLRPVLIFLTVISIIGGLQLFAEPVAVIKFAYLPFGGVNDSVLTVLMHFYDVSFRNFRFGEGATISVVMLLITFIFSYTTMNLGSRTKFKESKK